MVKLTMVGRVNDGLPLAQGARHLNKENDNFSSNYKQQAEFILKEISRGALPPSNMTIRVDHHSFNYLVVNGIWFITLCDSSYPRKLAFHYLQDLQKEFDKFDRSLIEKITTPYSFIRFDSIIANIRKQYIDTRTQTNLSKLNANRCQELDIITENMSDIIERRRNSEIFETLATPLTSSQVWGSPRLEAIALIWMPITIIAIVTSVFLWVGLIFTDDFLISTL
ncbi:25.3 kDa vesicle transport protein-like [Durio zibethinus]|uniref:25.3 kDa vesicle transport protein-like n=1 Tax=Durio zibethinus TaxID=66656 RepID=A0A6P5YDK7_DURZI|nr:25.3 kDa vesicle transport protein-like [Durio zibethinus]